MNKVLFGKRINKIRKEQHITSEGLSEKCGVNAVYIRQIESASRLPSLPVFVNLCNALGVSPYYLLADSLVMDEQEQINSFLKKLRSLTPKQYDIVTATLETLMKKLEE